MKSRDLELLIQQVLDGEIDSSDFARLEQELLASEEARSAYRKYTALHSSLEEAHGMSLSLVEDSVVPVDKVIRLQKAKAWRVAVVSAAAILLIGLVTMRLFFVSEREPALVFETSPGTQFELTHSGGNDDLEGTVLEKGSRLTLSQGTVELTFESGVKSIIMAPADLTLHDDDTLFLNQGTAWFQVPKGAEGFTVKTSDLDVVDLGTEFGVLAKPDEHDEVHVLKGKVEVTANRVRMESATLVAGEARRIDPVGRLTKIPAKAAAFMSELPKTLPYLHWSFDDGDHFQVSGTHPLAESITTTAESAPASVPGKRGTALSLDGKSQLLSTDWEGFSESRPRTVSFWLKIPAHGDYNDNPGILGWGDRTQKNGKWKITLDNKGANTPARIRLSWGSSWITSRANLSTDTWQHVVITSNGKLTDKGLPQADIYLNGSLLKIFHGAHGPREVIPPKTTTITSQSVPLMIGCDLYPTRGDRNFFTGEIDELTIFDGYMTVKDVQALISR